MDRKTPQLNKSEEIRKLNAERRLRRSLKMTSIMLVMSLIIILFPIVPLGHASDICLQVPSEQTLAPVESMGAPQTLRVTTRGNDTADRIEEALKNDTFVISAHTDRDGRAVEMLDASAFNICSQIVYVASSRTTVYMQPDTSSEIVTSLPYGERVMRTGIGSAWSRIEFIVNVPGADEEMVEKTFYGYVLSESLTMDQLATPTPVPTETPTPTPTPVPKENTPTPTPVPEKQEEPKATATPEPTPTPEPEEPAPTATPEPTIGESEMSGTFYSLGGVNVRTGPSTDFSVMDQLSRNDSVTVVAVTDNGWYKLDNGGYVRSDLVDSQPVIEETEPVETTTEESSEHAETTTTSETNQDPDEPSENPTRTANLNPDIPDPSSCDLLTYARAFVGIPYVWSGADLSGLDCSGFVSYVYAHYYHYSLPHQSAMIAELGTEVTDGEILPGDVICHDYNGDGRVDHVSLYCGDGVVIHASTSCGGIVEDWYPMSAMVTIRRFV